MNQYLIKKDDGYLKENGKITTTIERAFITPTKKSAQKYVDAYGGEIAPVYLYKNPIKYAKPPDERVWIVKKLCQVNGLTVMGPYFSQDEATNIYYDELKNCGHFKYVEQLRYNLGHGELKWAKNKLGDSIYLCEIRKAKI